jgi:hypothetical protein
MRPEIDVVGGKKLNVEPRQGAVSGSGLHKSSDHSTITFRIAPVLLPHLKRRPFTLARYRFFFLRSVVPRIDPLGRNGGCSEPVQDAAILKLLHA